jgi:hypothetical protein
VLKAGTDDILQGVYVECEVKWREFGGEEMADTLEQLLGCRIERGGREGGERAL